MRKFTYDLLVGDGVSRFFWSYEENFDLNIFAVKASKGELDSGEVEVFSKAKFLLKINTDDYIVYVNVPELGI